MTTTRTLMVLRHAKAEPFATSDHERVLAPRGVTDAADAGRWASEQGLVPDHVVVSSAARTLGTWDAFSAAAGCSPEVVVDRALYPAGTDAAIEILRTVPAEASTVLLIGHNPTMAQLVHLLDDGGGEPEVFARVAEDFPTSALAVLEVTGPWDEIDVAGARLRAFHVGRG